MEMTDLVPRYCQVMFDLEQMANTMSIGDRIKPERDLANQFSVSRETVRKALRMLSEKGVLESRQGSGTYVCRHLTGRAVEVLATDSAATSDSAATVTHVIGLSVPTIEVPTIAKFVAGVQKGARELGYQVLLAPVQDDPKRQGAQIRNMLDQNVDGLIVFLDRDNVTNPECVELLCQCKRDGRNIVMVDRYIPGLDLPCVLTDTARGMYEMTQHMIMTGHRRFGVLSWGEQAGIAERNRFAGFRNALRDHGIDSEPVLHGKVGYVHPQDATAEQIVARWLMEHNNRLPCDAIICFVDDMARGAFRALKQAGLRVPQDIAISGFDNVQPETDRSMGLDLTTVEQPFDGIGRVAAERLVQSMRSKQTDAVVRHTMLPPKLVIRRSCGADMRVVGSRLIVTAPGSRLVDKV